MHIEDATNHILPLADEPLNNESGYRCITNVIGAWYVHANLYLDLGSGVDRSNSRPKWQLSRICKFAANCHCLLY